MPNERVLHVSRLLHRYKQHAHTVSYSEGMVKRVRRTDVNVTTSNADFEVQHTAKTNQAWRYQGGQILRAPTIMLGKDNPKSKNKRYEDPKNPGQPRRKQESNFFITINSNKSPEAGEEMDAAIKAMESMLGHISQEHILAKLVVFGPAPGEVGAPYKDDQYADVIHNVDWRSGIETGDQMCRLHAHIIVTIIHYSQIQLNPKALQYESRRAFNENIPRGYADLRINRLPWVYIKLLAQSNWGQIQKQYIHKGMLAVG